MEKFDVYKNIITRGGGELYLGVVGPVRTGKSTLIAKMMELLVIPSIENANERQRAVDEMPQSANGKTVMTTQPKFIPSKGARINIGGQIKANIRLIDCVGYMVSGAEGHKVDDKPRMVKTPWDNLEIPFEKAAEIGTRKVVTDHSNIAVVVTCDGSIDTELKRASYVAAEERCVTELKALGKPFIVVLNSSDPMGEPCQKLRASLEAKYNCGVVAINVKEAKEEEILAIFNGLLNEFPLNAVEVVMPDYLTVLPMSNIYVAEVIAESKKAAQSIKKMGDYDKFHIFTESENFLPTRTARVQMDEGKIEIEVTPHAELFFKVLSGEAGREIKSDFELVSCLKQYSEAKYEYDKIKEALQEVEETGYGIVSPAQNQLVLEEPEILKKGGKFGVRLKASAPSLHIMKVNIVTEVNPILGTEQQSEMLVKEMLQQYETDTKQLWETNIFGRSLNSLVNEGLKNKLISMPLEAKKKMSRAVGKIVNEGKGGVVCILL